MAQDAREPYYDDTGSTHSVSTASDLHEQVRSNEQTNWLAYSLIAFCPSRLSQAKARSVRRSFGRH